MDYDDLLELVYRTAVDNAKRGLGWAQQNSVLWDVRNRVSGSRDVRVQQQILTCWHDLFRLGRLSWGYDIDNPDSPFFHIPDDDPHRDLPTKSSKSSDHVVV